MFDLEIKTSRSHYFSAAFEKMLAERNLKELCDGHADDLQILPNQLKRHFHVTVVRSTLPSNN